MDLSVENPNDDIYPCPLCNHQSESAQHQLNHYREVHERNQTALLKCQICDNTYQRKQHLDRHTLNSHRKEVEDGTVFLTCKVHKCTACPFQTTNATQFSEHLFFRHGVNVKNIEKLKCEKCDYATYRKFMLDRHTKTHSNVKVKPFQCTLCDKGFYLEKHLEFHVVTYHSGIKIEGAPVKTIHTCLSCEYATENRRAFIKHKLFHKALKSSVEYCTACDKGFKSKYDFDHHILKCHRFEDNFLKLMTFEVRECTRCVFMTLSLDHLKIHMERVHRIKWKEKEFIETKTMDLSLENPNDNMCDHQSESAQHRLNHYREVHKRNQAALLKCQICDNTYQRKQHLDGHTLNSHRKEIEDGRIFLTCKIHKCTSCPFQTINATQFSEHLVLHHGVDVKNIKKLKCAKCDYVTHRKYRLVRHLKKHSDVKAVKPFPCTLCDKGFYIEKHLEFHVVTYHSGIKIEGAPVKTIHTCPSCKYTTKNSRAFTKHKLFHKPLKSSVEHCTACDKGFKSKYDFDHHILMCHRFEDNFLKLMTFEVRECTRCVFMTLSLDQLKIHMERVHRMKWKSNGA